MSEKEIGELKDLLCIWPSLKARVDGTILVIHQANRSVSAVERRK